MEAGGVLHCQAEGTKPLQQTEPWLSSATRPPIKDSLLTPVPSQRTVASGLWFLAYILTIFPLGICAQKFTEQCL